MAYRRRNTWTTAPKAKSARLNPLRVKGVAIHWNGPAVPKSALSDPRPYLEGVRRYHTAGNGWSDFAYNLAVDQNGDIWEGRGLGWQSAANGTADLNEQWVAVLAVLGQGQTPSRKMVRGLRKARRLARRRYPLGRRIVGHGDIRPSPTACPGPDLQRLIDDKRLTVWRPKPKPPCAHCPHHCP